MLSTPPAFILSQDQTLMFLFRLSCQFLWLSPGLPTGPLRFRLVHGFPVLYCFWVVSLKDLFSEISDGIFSIPCMVSHALLWNFQGCITVYLSRYTVSSASATAYLEYHSRLPLSTTFLKFFQTFSPTIFLHFSREFHNITYHSACQ